jgi:acetyl-CoA C-acetyltransferase
MTNVVIASAARTPVGSFNGAFAATPAHDLGAAVLEALVARAGIDKGEVSETILGQVLTAGQGQNPARQAHINAGLPKEAAAWSINQVCGSGLRAVALGAQHIMLGDADIVAAGGQENMSLSPHVAHLRAGHKMGDMSFIDSMIKDGLWDAFNGYHMGNTAENVAQRVADRPRPAGRIRRRLAEQGRGGAEGGPLRRRDRALHRQDPQGRHGRGA